MNEIVERNNQLPDTLEDLTQFVLVGKAKLQAYMLKLQTVNKLSVAQEIRDQTLKETQEVSNALIAAEQRIGELLLAIPKQSGMRTDLETSVERSTEVKTKAETIANMGYGVTEAKDYQQMAKHPEVVQKVIDDALANGEVVTKASVMREIKHYKDRVKAQQEEIDTLRNQKPKEVKVVPEDYEKIKRENSTIRSENDLLSKERKQYLDERNAANKRIKELEEREGIHDAQIKLERESEYLGTQINSFIRNVGGYVWVTEQIEKLPEEKRMDVIKAIRNINAWSQQMLINIGGTLNE